MATKLTKKQKGFIKDYIETGNGTLAAKRNYDVSNENTAAVIATENLTKPKIINALEEALPDELLAERHKQLLNKKETIREWNEEKKLYNIMKTDEIDTQAVSKGLEMAYKIKGYYAPEKHLNINTNAEELREAIKNDLLKFRA